MKTVKISILLIVLVCIMCGCGKKKEAEKEVVLNETVSDNTQSSGDDITQEQGDINNINDNNAGDNNQSPEPNNTIELLEAKNSSNFTVVIDAGHQITGNSELEPIGPGASEKKAKVSTGTTGGASGVPEYRVTLQVSKKIEKLLKSKGYRVIMVRDTNEVNISNSERAQIANNADADAFIRIHCNGSDDPSVYGALTMCQTKNNPYCGNLYTKSRKLSQKLIDRICEATGAKNRGILESDSMSGINWCNVPVSIIEMGFMSNREEDLLLVNDEYQEKMAVGICNGVIEYLNTQQ